LLEGGVEALKEGSRVLPPLLRRGSEVTPPPIKDFPPPQTHSQNRMSWLSNLLVLIIVAIFSVAAL
jgi:hypothetical protein